MRSPLARIRAELEVDLAHPEAAALLATHRSVLDETDALQSVVNDLLLLARTDDPAAFVSRTPVDLDDVVLDQVRRLRETGTARVDAARVSAAQVLGERSQLARVVRNLLDNAAQHGGSAIDVSLVEHDGMAILTVSDDGPGIPLDQRERVFERFARIDEARTPGAPGGSGLGLAIAREILTRHGGTVTVSEVTDGPGPGASFVVQLPATRLGIPNS